MARQDVTIRFGESENNTASSVTSGPITWTFDTDYTVGQYADNQYYVVDPGSGVTIEGFSPASTSGAREINGSEANPDPNGDSQGYDSSMTYNIYSSTLNIALDVDSGSPYVASGGTSIVSTISNTSAGVTPQLTDCQILTVVNAEPSANSFRPPYVGTDKTSYFNVSDIDYGPLASLELTASAYSWAAVEGYFDNGPWLDYRGFVGSRMMHPSNNMKDYGGWMCSDMGIASLYLNSDASNATKETLMIYFLQYGIDLQGVVDEGFEGWYMDGGQGPGRKFPILFAGHILNDSTMKDIVNSTTYFYDSASGPVFGEDQTTIYMYQAEAERYGTDPITDPYPEDNEERDDPDAYYTEADWTYNDNASGNIGLPEYSKSYASVWQGRWISRTIDASYRINHAGFFDSFILSVFAMGLTDEWNHMALFEYADRWYAWGDSEGIPSYQIHWDSFAEEMWDEHRAKYLYTPLPLNVVMEIHDPTVTTS